MGKRHTLGLVLAEITGHFLMPLFRAVKESALATDSNLIIFEGRQLNSPAPGESQQNIIYQLLKNHRTSSTLIACGSVFQGGGQQNKAEFIKNNLDGPIVSISDLVEGHPSILVDGYAGIQSIVDHLISVHGCNRIAFVTGPKISPEAQERLTAYQDTLARHGKPSTPDLIIEGDFRPESGKIAARALIDGKIICDAMVFANDDMALSAMNYLELHAPELRERTAITGFDDIPGARNAKPQLTTASQPISTMCEIAVDVALKQVANEPVELVHKCPSELKVRQTCGCFHIDSDWSEDNHVFLFLHKLYEEIQTFDLSEICEKLEHILALYSTSSMYLVLFKNKQMIPATAEFPERVELIYQFENCKGEMLNNPIVFNSKDILPDQCFARDKAAAFLVRPLCFRDYCFGYITYEFENQYEGFYEAIHGHLALVLNAALSNS